MKNCLLCTSRKSKSRHMHLFPILHSDSSSLSLSSCSYLAMQRPQSARARRGHAAAAAAGRQEARRAGREGAGREGAGRRGWVWAPPALALLLPADCRAAPRASGGWAAARLRSYCPCLCRCDSHCDKHYYYHCCCCKCPTRLGGAAHLLGAGPAAAPARGQYCS